MVFSGEYFFCGRHTPPFYLPKSNDLKIEDQLNEFINKMPSPISMLMKEYLLESQPFLALHRLCDLCEMITRFMAIVGLSTILDRDKEFSSSIKNILSNELERPTFGSWKNIAGIAFQELKNSETIVSTDLLPFWENTWMPFIGHGTDHFESKIIPLRNKLAHGGRMSEEDAKTLHIKFNETIREIMFKMDFLSHYHMITKDTNRSVDVEDKDLLSNHVYLFHEKERLNLFPLLTFDAIKLWNEENQTFQKLNDHAHLIYQRYNSGRNIIEFSSIHPNQSFSQSGDPFVNKFFHTFNIQEWRQRQNEKGKFKELWPKWDYTFLDITTDLTSLIVGRSTHITDMKNWVKDNKHTGGALLITGQAGVGKSAVMARYLQSAQGNSKNVVIPFFFRSGDIRCTEDNFYYIAILKLLETFNLTIEIKLNSLKNDFMNLIYFLQENILEQSGKTLIFLLDGLDELLSINPETLQLQELSKQPNILWILSGRSELEVHQKFHYADKLWNEDGELPPLNKHAIRRLIEAECGNKKYNLYSLDWMDKDGEYQNDFVEALVKRSEGLPIYIHFVIEDIKENRLNFHDIHSLPQNLDVYYKTLMNRLKVNDLIDLTNRIFGILSWANEPLSFEDFYDILRDEYNKEMVEDWKDILTDALSYGNVVLRKVKNRYGKASWILYHETFRYFLKNDKNSQIIRSRGLRLLIEWCEKWEDIGSKDEGFTYALEHYSSHLLEQNQKNKLYLLANNETFIDNQITYTEQFSASFRLYKHVMIMANKCNDYDKTLSAAKKALNLHDRLSDEYEDIIAWAQAGTYESVSKALKRISFSNDHDRFLLYFLFLYYYLKDNKNHQQEHVKNLSLISNEIKGNSGKTYWLIPALQLLHQFESYTDPVHSLQDAVIDTISISSGTDVLYLVKQQLITLDQAFTLTVNMMDHVMKKERLVEIILYAIENDEIEKALNMVERISDFILQSELYAVIAQRYVTYDFDYKGAIETIEKIMDDEIKADVLKEVMDAAIEHGYKLSLNKEHSLCLTVWKEVAHDIVYTYFDYDTLEETAYHLAVLIKDYCLKVLPKLDMNDHMDIIYLLRSDGRIEESTHDQILYEIAHGYVKNNHVEKALQLVDEMRLYEYQQESLIKLAGELVKSNNLVDAISLLGLIDKDFIQLGIEYAVSILTRKPNIKAIISSAQKEMVTDPDDLHMIELLAVQLAKYNHHEKAKKLVNGLIRHSRKSFVLRLIDNIQTEFFQEPTFEFLTKKLESHQKKQNTAKDSLSPVQNAFTSENLINKDIHKKIQWAYTINDKIEKLTIINKLSIQLANDHHENDILSVLKNQVGKLNNSNEAEDEIDLDKEDEDWIVMDTSDMEDRLDLSFTYERMIKLVDLEKFEEAITAAYELEEKEDRNNLLISIGNRLRKKNDMKLVTEIIPLIDNDEIKESFIVQVVDQLLESQEFITALEVTVELRNVRKLSLIETIAEHIVEYYSEKQELSAFLFHGKVNRLTSDMKRMLYNAVLSTIASNETSSKEIIAEILPDILLNRELLEYSVTILERDLKSE